MTTTAGIFELLKEIGLYVDRKRDSEVIAVGNFQIKSQFPFWSYKCGWKRKKTESSKNFYEDLDITVKHGSGINGDVDERYSFRLDSITRKINLLQIEQPPGYHIFVCEHDDFDYKNHRVVANKGFRMGCYGVDQFLLHPMERLRLYNNGADLFNAVLDEIEDCYPSTNIERIIRQNEQR